MPSSITRGEPAPPTPAPEPNPGPPRLFVGRTKSGQVCYILRDSRGEEISRTPVNEHTQANDKPKGFFSSLARLYAGGPR